MIWVVAALLAVLLARAMHREIVESNRDLCLSNLPAFAEMVLDIKLSPWQQRGLDEFANNWKKRGRKAFMRSEMLKYCPGDEVYWTNRSFWRWP